MIQFEMRMTQNFKERNMSHALITIQFALCARNFFFYKKLSLCILIEVKLFNAKKYGKSVSVNMQINVILRNRLSWNFEFKFSPFIYSVFLFIQIVFHTICSVYRWTYMH